MIRTNPPFLNSQPSKKMILQSSPRERSPRLSPVFFLKKRMTRNPDLDGATNVTSFYLLSDMQLV